MKLNNAIKSLVTQIVARNIAAGVELARSIGHKMPTEFDVGVRFVEDGVKTRVRMRLNDVSYDAIVELPHLDGRHPLRTVDTMWKEAWERIHADALTVSQVWLSHHPEALAESPEALNILDALTVDDEASQRWMADCAERAKHFRYDVR